MNEQTITPEQSRAARTSLGLSQAFIARETGINRSQLALFEVGKYQLEKYKLLALRDCYLRLGYPLDGKAPSPVPVKPLPNPNSPPQHIIDGLLVGKGLTKEAVEGIRAEIALNDASISEFAQKPFKRDWITDEPITEERDAIFRLMARNYQLMRNLQGREPLPRQTKDAKTGRVPEPKTSGDLAVALFTNPEALKNGS